MRNEWFGTGGVMDCKEFRELLDLYVDGELSTEATISARAHLRECVACSRVELQMSRLRAGIKRVVSEHHLPPELAKNITSVARPGWGKGMGLKRHGVMYSDQTVLPFWQGNVALPVPVFALILVVASVVGGLIASPRTAPPSPSNAPGVRKLASDSPMTQEATTFDLTQFDKGGRAAIYKVRSSDFTNSKQ